MGAAWDQAEVSELMGHKHVSCGPCGRLFCKTHRPYMTHNVPGCPVVYICGACAIFMLEAAVAATDRDEVFADAPM